MKNLLETKALDVGYGKKTVISDISLEVIAGQIVTLIGPNGSGKSTVLKTITRQLAEHGGSISICERAAKTLSDAEFAKHLSMVMTERIQPELMTCREVISTGRYPYTGRLGILSREDRNKVEEAIGLIRLDDIADWPFDRVSDGQRQRVMLARAICQDTEIIVLDEPTAYLDMKYKLELLKLIRDLARHRNKAILMSLHELDLAGMISDTVVCVKDGHVVKAGSPGQLYQGNFIQELFDIDPEEYDPRTGRICLK